jgi:hypothetical protein
MNSQQNTPQQLHSPRTKPLPHEGYTWDGQTLSQTKAGQTRSSEIDQGSRFQLLGRDDQRVNITPQAAKTEKGDAGSWNWK